VAYLSNPEAEREQERVAILHCDTWFEGGSLEDIPEKDRDPSLWESACRYGPFLYGDALSKMVQEGEVSMLEELLDAGIDFTRFEGITEDEIRAYLNKTSNPNTPHKL
jgi:hypothetical protein